MTREENTEDLCLTDVTKVFKLGLFKAKVAVQNLSLSVQSGQVVGLLGPNGSGKSTTIKMLLGFIHPTSGEILVCGRSAKERQSRALIGYLPENPRFQKFLTANDVLKYYGSLLGLNASELKKRIPEFLELVNLTNAARERVQGFSKGMTQRLAIAQALLHRPRVLVFDEPMSGLDPIGRIEIRRLIARIHQEMAQCTIFFSTHILSDVEELCSSVAVLRKGRLTTFCPINELLNRGKERFDVVVKEVPPPIQKRYRENFSLKPTPLGTGITLDGTDQLIDCLSELRSTGAVIVGITSQRRSLEEALFKEDGELPPADSPAPPLNPEVAR